ncbi:MAG: endonuclease/exonuclease/phosphatase family protein [Archangium sp.]
MRVVTWNVLHRIHAENWAEDSVAAFPDEAKRVEGLTRQISDWLAGDVDVVCLQEVSGDLLEALRSAIRVNVFTHKHPRLPMLKRPSGTQLQRPAEYLVTFSKRDGTRTAGHEYPQDGGKGALEVELEHGVTVINTHVSTGHKHTAQFATLASLLTPRCVVAGDFNELREVVHPALGNDLVCSDLRGQLATRFGQSKNDGKVIDHVLVRGGVIVSATVLDTGHLSDHRPVKAVIDFG